MKIAFVAQPMDSILPPYQNSIGIFIYEIIKRLPKSYRIKVYAKDGKKYKYINKRPELNFKCINLWMDNLILRFLGRMLRPFCSKTGNDFFYSSVYYIGYILQIALDLRKNKIDVAHVFNFSQFVPVIRFFNPKIKIVLHMHCEWLTQLDYSLIKKRIQYADLIIGCSDYLTYKIMDKFPEASEKCGTIFNGVNINEFYIKNTQFEPEYKEIKKILFVGRISPEKGLHYLLDAFKKVANDISDIQLQIIGTKSQLPLSYILKLSENTKINELKKYYNGSLNNSYYLYLKQKIATLKLDKNVRFEGFVPYAQIVDYYKKATILVNPSLSESFGRSLIEAMSCGIPVIASRVGGMTEIIDSGTTGFLVDPGDISALSNAILMVLGNKIMRKKIAEEGRIKVTNLFTWEKCAGNLTSLYEAYCL